MNKTEPKATESIGMPRVSVVLPVRNEAHYITRSLTAVMSQDYPLDLMEVIVADGMSTDGTREIIGSFQARYPNLLMIDNLGKIAPTGLNAAIARANGEVFIRVDGHCEIDGDYVRRCVERLRDDGVDGVGGPVETVGETFLARVIAVAMSSPFGVGNSSFRTVKNRTMLADTIPFPAYNRSIMERVGFFDEELVRNQDDDYNYRLRKIGAKILLAADVRSRYYSRSSIRSLWRQYFQYGYWKVRVMQKVMWQMRLRQLVPALFLAVLLLSLLMAPLSIMGIVVFALTLGSYALANIVASVLTARKRAWRMLLALPLCFATLHFAFGFGFLVGLVRFWNRWGDRESRWKSQTAAQAKI
ncbi:MAG TPA: glycosyltransferase family 2 protein [Blastocatellia bacterium]|nr:glycosyltransferase family 2 protein [Blastocatellia bacterium]